MRVLLNLLILVGAATAAPENLTRIVGGEDTTIQEYPFMSNMQYLFSGIFWSQACGGTLITPTSILSAAHCYFLTSTLSWQARLGSSFASSQGTVHAVTLFRYPLRYSHNNLDFDVIILKIREPASLGSNIRLAPIAGPLYNVPDGTSVTAIGWGALWDDGPYPEQLQRVEINIINQELCAERYAFLKAQPGFENLPVVTNNMLCAGILDVGGKDACQGDSGGPLLHNDNVVVGITSWGQSCADSFYPGVNTRISEASDWILMNAI